MVCGSVIVRVGIASHVDNRRPRNIYCRWSEEILGQFHACECPGAEGARKIYKENEVAVTDALDRVRKVDKVDINRRGPE